MLKVAIIAGEPSGDMLASGLMRELKKQSIEPISFFGIGGDKMELEGLNSEFAMSILSVMGYFDVIKSLIPILKVRHAIIKKIIEFKPDVFIGIDAPDFNFYVEKKLKESGIKTVHYISPTIWAWRYERIFKIKQSTDLVLCIFPMEEPLYKAENIKAKFVGHPLADQIELNVDTQSYKDRLHLSGTVFTILVGSRVREINNLAGIFIETCNLIAREIPSATFLFPFTNTTTHDLFFSYLNKARVNFKYQLLINQTSGAIKASDMVLAKSGTVSLEVALSKKPLIISYKIAKITEWLLKRKLKIKYVGQPNILLNEEVAPELLQEKANPHNLARNFVELFNDKSRQQTMLAKFHQLHQILRKEASFNAARAVLELVHHDN